jgi:hypothetical protein
MPYARKEDKAKQMQRYRASHKGDELRKQNRLGFLELEVTRLTRALEHALFDCGFSSRES